MQIAVAPEHEAVILPRFEVEEIEGTVTVMIATPQRRKNNAGKSVSNGFNFEPKEVDGGFMVYFPAGHSIRVKDEQELQRLGFMGPAPLVDMNTGEIVPVSPNVSLKDRAGRKTSNRRRIEHVAPQE
jgi:hypothetical protein